MVVNYVGVRPLRWAVDYVYEGRVVTLWVFVLARGGTLTVGQWVLVL